MSHPTGGVEEKADRLERVVPERHEGSELEFVAPDEVTDIEGLSRRSAVAPLAASRKGETAVSGRDC